MAKLNYNSNHSRYLGNMDSDFWNNPKRGFDSSWHQKYKSTKLSYAPNTQASNYRQPKSTLENKKAIEEARQKLGYK